jgi:hypothetical protein
MFKGLEALVKEGDLKTFGTAWPYGPDHILVKVENNPFRTLWQMQKNLLTQCCNLPKEEHFDNDLCTYCIHGFDRSDPDRPFLVWPEGYAGPGRGNGVIGNFWDLVISHRDSWRNAWNAAGKGPTPGLQNVFNAFLDGKCLENEKDLPIQPGMFHRLAEHPIHMVLGYIISKNGFGFDLRKFESFEAFESVITYQFVAKILAICCKAGMK